MVRLHIAVTSLLLASTQVFAQDLSDCVSAQQEKNLGNTDKSISLYSSCIDKGDLSVKNKSVALNNRGNIYLGQNRYNYASADFDQSIKLMPGYANAYNNRGMVNQFKGLYKAAIEDFSKALELDEDHLNAANNLAWIFATCPVGSLRDGKRALELAIKVNGATNYQYSTNLDTLAAAYAETGDFALAISYQEKAMKLGSATERTEQKNRLSYYKQDRAYRDLSGL